jgi:type I restriction enzyme, S subunit
MKPGYKQTEAGVIPEDWEVKPLKRISPKQSVGLVINPSTYFDRAGTVPLLVGSNVSENAIDPTTANRITEASNEMLFASRLAAGDLVTVRVGEPGVTAVVPPELDGCNCASMMIIRKHPSFDSHWLCYAMNSQHGRQQVEHVQYGTAQKQFNISDAVDFRLPVPPFHEQRAIAGALRDVDALLGALDRLIGKKRDLKQAAMQQLLTGQTRLSGFQNEWDQVRLGDLFSFKNGLNKAKQFFGYGTPIVNYMDVFGRVGMYALDLKGRVSLSKAELKNFDVQKGDVFFTRTSETREEIGVASVMLDEPTDTVFSGFVLRARPLCQRLNDRFKAYCFHSAQVRNQIISKASYTTRALTNGRILSEVSLAVPPLAEQIAIANVLSDMDEELTGLEQRREKTRALKQGMIQELLTGRTRLVSANESRA